MLLSKMFRQLGATVGTRPLTFFIASVVLFIISVLILLALPPEMRLSFDRGYTTSDAPSIRELRTQIEFFGSKGKPWYMALFAEPRDMEKGSMIESKEFDEFKDFYKSVKKIVIRRDGDRNVTYFDYCGTTCNVNDQIFKTHAMAWFGLQWPETSIFIYKSNIGKFFFQREMKGEDIVSAKLAALYFITFINSTDAIDDLREYESIVADYVAKHNADESKVTTITQHSARGMQMEVARGMKFVFGKLIAGIFLAGLIILLCFLVLNRIQERCNGRVVLLSLGATFLPVMALTTAAALCSLVGAHFNTMCVAAPALVFALGIDGMLILYHSWITQHKTHNVQEHMAQVFQSAFPSITIVSSAAIGLIAGRLIPIEEFAMLSFFLGVTTVLVYVYLVCYFPALMLWCANVHTHSPLSQELPTSPKVIKRPWFDGFLEQYARGLSSSLWMKIFAVSLFCLCLALPTYLGSSKVNANLDYRQLLPPDSPNNKGVHFMSDVVWYEFFNIMYFIEKPPNFDDPRSYQRFKSMISDFESLPGSIKKSGMMWINDYERHTDMIGNETALNTSHFKDFITHDIYKAWNSGVKYRFEGNTTVITEMMYIGAYEGLKTLWDKARLLSQCRQVVSKYPEFDVVPFDTEVGMVDVLLQIPYVTYFVPFLVLAGSTVVTMLLIKNLAVSILVLISYALIYTESYCISSLFGLALNPFSASFLIFVAGVSLKYSAHMCYQYQQGSQSETLADDVQRLVWTFRQTFLSVLMSSIAGSMVFLPMLLTNVLVFRWLAVINVITLLIGAVHAVLLTPLILVWLPSSATSSAFFCKSNRKSDNVDMKNISS
ncbi:unnamed protein product [Cylicocyclus nassatus]|uniref:SSD domain-containing protein n=1 Tax=Cylicocyclus nassatus TaxID=53992 RepID=A0AA36MCL5_CYLNA|nr:unnamed protein product [Cylicocyclus nassatus]